MRRLRNVELNEQELFRLKVMDAYERMEPKNVRYLCRLMGIHHSTFYRLKKQYKHFNLNSLKLRSRRPKHTRTSSWTLVMEMCNWKRENPAKSHYYLYQLWLREGRTPPCSPKTIYNWWKRRGLIAKKHRRSRRKTKLFNQASVVGELVQIDTKYLNGRRRFQYTAIDVVSKWRFIRAYNKQTQENTIDFLKRLIRKAEEKGIKILLIQTDNGHEFQLLVREYLSSVDISHQYIWIHTPDQNGVVERSHRTDDDEFYHLTETQDLTLDELNLKLEEWTLFYNTKRLHFSLNFDTPEEYLVSHI